MYIDYELELDKLEADFLETHGAALYVDIPPKINLASRWAAGMDAKHQTSRYSQMVNEGGYCTGRCFGYFIVAFPKWGADGFPKGFVAYRLCGKPFGDGEKWFDPPEWVVLDGNGNLIVDVAPLPLDGTLNPSAKQIAQYRKDWHGLRRFKDEHHGRTPEQETKYQERRKRWRQKNYLKEKNYNV